MMGVIVLAMTVVIVSGLKVAARFPQRQEEVGMDVGTIGAGPSPAASWQRAIA
jgi:hypothetical protein